MDITGVLLITAFPLGLALLGVDFCLWLMKKAGIQPLEGPYWKIYHEHFTGTQESPRFSGSRRSGRSGGSRPLWSWSRAWYVLPKKCAVISVEAVVTQGRGVLEIYGDQGLLRRWESWENPKFMVDLQCARRVRYVFSAQGFTGSVCCAGRRRPPAA